MSNYAQISPFGRFLGRHLKPITFSPFSSCFPFNLSHSSERHLSIEGSVSNRNQVSALTATILPHLRPHSNANSASKALASACKATPPLSLSSFSYAAAVVPLIGPPLPHFLPFRSLSTYILEPYLKAQLCSCHSLITIPNLPGLALLLGNGQSPSRRSSLTPHPVPLCTPSS